MANADKPNGLTPIGTLSGADYHGKMRRVAFAVGDAVVAFVGDLVKLTGTVDATGKIPVVAQSAAGDASIGVLVSLDFNADDEGSLATSRLPLVVFAFSPARWALVEPCRHALGGLLAGEELGRETTGPLERALLCHPGHLVHQALGVTERVDIDPVRSAMRGVQPGVSRLFGNFLRLDHPDDLRFARIGLGVDDMQPRGPEARHDEIAPLDMGMRCIGAQA